MAQHSEEPKLSVLVTAYNLEPYLAQCLDSIISQRVNFKFQILVADDCSKDGTAGVLQKYEQQYPDIVRAFYNNPNLGCSRNLCMLIDNAQTELIIQIDGDDYITDETKLQRQVDIMDKHKDCSICFHNYTVVDSNGNNPVDKVITLNTDGIVPSNYLLHTELGPGNLAMIRRSALPKKLPEWVGKTSNQVDYITQVMALCAGKMYYINRVMTAYRQHATSVTALAKKKQALEWGTFNVQYLYNYCHQQGFKEGADFFRMILPYRYMTLGYFYLSESDVIKFLRYFLKGFFMGPDLHLKSHKDMLYSASPVLVGRMKKLIFWR